MEQVLNYAKTLIKSRTTPGDISVDATAGNGFDTLFLANLVTDKGIIFSFDIQEEAVNNTNKLLKDNNINNVKVFHAGHEKVSEYIPEEYHGKISSAVFNLGYLPKGNKEITTKGETTTEAIKQLLRFLKKGGIIVLVVYYGHTGGKEEMEKILDFGTSLNQKEVQVLKYQFINQINDAPFLIAFEKIK